MRTTLVISDPLFRRAKLVAHIKGMALSDLINEATENYLLQNEPGSQPRPGTSLKLPDYPMGEAKVDVSSREALYRAMEEE